MLENIAPATSPTQHGRNSSQLSMEDIQLTSWYVKYPIILQGFIHPRWFAGFLNQQQYGPFVWGPTGCLGLSLLSMMWWTEFRMCRRRDELDLASGDQIRFDDLCIWMFSKIGDTPKSSILIGFFHSKPSILGYPYFWKHSFDCVICVHKIYIHIYCI